MCKDKQSKSEDKSKGVSDMAALTTNCGAFVVREDKVKEFLEKISTPMITKDFLKKCQKADKEIRDKK